MILPYSLVFAGVFGILIYQQQQVIIIALSLIVSLLFYAHQCVIAKCYGLRKVFEGDFLYQLAFMVWLLFFQAPHFLHYIPLLLSNIGKVYIMVQLKTSQQNSAVHQLILFQNQTEAFILLTLLLELIGFGQWTFLKFISYALIVKIKYRFYGPTRKAYQEVHFTFDRLSRGLNMRAFYHVIYEALSMFSNDVQGRPPTQEMCY